MYTGSENISLIDLVKKIIEQYKYLRQLLEIIYREKYIRMLN